MGVRRYQATVHDSARWDGFEFRPGDIVISTPPKCGTTWTQMICALLVFQDPDLPAPLSDLSPWLDMSTQARCRVVEALDAQTHRRFMKSHTPLDGLPVRPDITYICVGRDPRDVAISMDHHMANMDREEFVRAVLESAALDGIEPPTFELPTPPPDDPRERLWQWMDDETDPTETVWGLRFTIAHLQSFHAASPDVDVVLLHYDDLQADLESQMRMLAQRLGIDVAEDRWPTLVAAASFASMRGQAETRVPAGAALWQDTTRFFRSGTSGQWRELLDADDVARYATLVRSLASPDLVDWLHREPLPLPV